jgi:ribosomal protein S6--L-glutamate ligase
VGLEVAAVDLLDAQGRLKVFDVNASPSLPETEAATGVDLAGLIIERAEALVAETACGPVVLTRPGEVLAPGPPAFPARSPTGKVRAPGRAGKVSAGGG